jgi:hypothetical protein
VNLGLQRKTGVDVLTPAEALDFMIDPLKVIAHDLAEC